MSNPGGGLLRLARGGLLAVCCTALALLGHLAGGGRGVPSLPVLLAVTALVGAGFCVLADRRRQFHQILAGALAAQVAFHLSFSLAAPIGAAHGAAYVHGGPVDVDPPMLVGHGVAAAAIAILVSRGEDLVWALFHLLGLVWLPRPDVLPAVGMPRAMRSAPADSVATAGALLPGRVHPRRGPPTLVAG